MKMVQKPNILLIYTGGTIGMVKDYLTGSLKPLNFNKLLKKVPELVQLECNIDSISFDGPIDSSNMDTGHWITLAGIIESHYATHDGFVVLHGSDTMAYSASALSFMLENLAKPVIFTGSQLPIGDLRTDAKENLITSIQIAALHENGMPVVQEVGLYFEYKLYRANRTTKINAEHFQAFASLNYPPLIESGVHLKVNRACLMRPKKQNALKVHKSLDTNVAIVKLFPGINGKIFESLLGIDGLKALVLETYGAGNAPTQDWLLNALQKVIDAGVHVVNVTQCSGGSVMMGQYETSRQLKNMQVINGKDITTEAAITKLMFLLTAKLPRQAFKKSYEKSLRGEMK